MENYYEKEQHITAAFSDRRCELDVYHATLLFQDAMTELFYQYQCDAVRLSKTPVMWWNLPTTCPIVAFTPTALQSPLPKRALFLSV